MRLVLVLCALAFAISGGVARADDDDDDPKSSHSRMAPKPDKPVKELPPPKLDAKPEPRVEAKPAKVESKPEPPKAEAKVAPKAETKPAKAELKPEPLKAEVPAKAETAPKAEPLKAEPKPVAKPEKPAKAEAPKAEAPKAEAPRAEAPKAEPKASLLAEPPPPSGTRSVRVRLMDGSTIAGTVRAELSESLVIDCNLGLLSIPRARIATISYDSGNATKRAPVQQLDDDLPPRKR